MSQPNVEPHQGTPVILRAMKIGELAFFLNAAMLLIPNGLLKAIVAVATAPLIVAPGFLLLVNRRGSIRHLKQRYKHGDSALASVIGDWPNYFWRTLGASIVLLGLTIWIIGIAAIA